MLRRFLQLLVRMAPNAAKVAWNAVPDALRRKMAPLVHPIAAGARSTGPVLKVSCEKPAAELTVFFDSADVTEARAATVGAGRPLIGIGADDDLIAIARPRGIVDAVVMCRAADARVPSLRRFGFRWLPPTAEHIASAFPTVTVVVATYDNRDLCESCLNGLARNTAWPSLRIVVVDNGSRDGTGAMLARVASRDARVKVITNEENRGFAGGTNQGLALSNSEYVVLLNDDTIVAPGWLARLIAHLEGNPRLGLVCPVTNQIGNAAKIATRYVTLEEMEAFAIERAFAHPGELEPTDVVALFCAAARRSVLESVGYLDERYEIGLFEDDDLARALRERGYGLAIARDSFVHHVGQASFAKMSDAQYLRIWQENKRRFERKWSTTWKPPA